MARSPLIIAVQFRESLSALESNDRAAVLRILLTLEAPTGSTSLGTYVAYEEGAVWVSYERETDRVLVTDCGVNPERVMM